MSDKCFRGFFIIAKRIAFCHLSALAVTAPPTGNSTNNHRPDAIGLKMVKGIAHCLMYANHHINMTCRYIANMLLGAGIGL